MITERHDSILALLSKATIDANRFEEVQVNRTIPIHRLLGSTENVPRELQDQRPDLVAINSSSKQLVISDVTVPFDNGPGSIVAARDKKILKYSPLAEVFSTKGWTVTVTALVTGALGAWDYQNFHTLTVLGVQRRSQPRLARAMVSEAILGSRLIYITHITGIKQKRLQQQQ